MEYQEWDMQPDEKQNWFGRFEKYRLMGSARRSLLAAYNIERAEEDKKNGVVRGKAINAPKPWQDESKLRRWKERAEAWDKYEIQRTRDELEAERQKNREARRKTSQALMVLLGKTTKAASEGNLAPEPQRLHQLAQAAAVIFKESRIEYGESTEFLDITSSSSTVLRQESMDEFAADYRRRMEEIKLWEAQQQNENVNS